MKLLFDGTKVLQTRRSSTSGENLFLLFLKSHHVACFDVSPHRMTLKLCFSSLCALFATSVLSAQSAMVFHPNHTERTNLSKTIQSLEQNALLFLIGAVVFLGICWLFYVLKSCVDLNKKQSTPLVRNRRHAVAMRTS